MQHKLISMVAMLVTLYLAPHSWAQDTKGEVTIEGDELEVIDSEDKTIWRGNVIVVRDGTTIKSNELIVNNVDVKQADGTTKSEVDVLNAKGNVTIKTASDTITSDWANIYEREDRLEAGGNVKLLQGRNEVRGQKLNVNLKTKRTVMTGGRVKGSFVPK
jgi:lipopolysaccharide export system protein LptA